MTRTHVTYARSLVRHFLQSPRERMTHSEEEDTRKELQRSKQTAEKDWDRHESDRSSFSVGASAAVGVTCKTCEFKVQCECAEQAYRDTRSTNREERQRKYPQHARRS